jgi:uncharacterized protein (TIGR03643 family)
MKYQVDINNILKINIKPIKYFKSIIISLIFRQYVFILLNLKLIMNIDKNRVIEMAWEDYTPFDAIKSQFGISEAEVIKLMRNELKRSSFKMWRKRVKSNISRKHPKKKLVKFNFFELALN